MAEALVSKYVQTQLRALNAALTNGQFVSVRKLLLELPPSDVAHILNLALAEPVTNYGSSLMVTFTATF